MPRGGGPERRRGQTPRSVGRPGKERNLKGKAGEAQEQGRVRLRSAWTQDGQAEGARPEVTRTGQQRLLRNLGGRWWRTWGEGAHDRF